MAPHEVIGLIGASGSGKSTLLRCVNLLERIDAGTIWLDGQTITRPGVDENLVRRHIGIVFQSFNLFPHMTVERNVTLAPMKVLGLSRADAVAQEITKAGGTALAVAADAAAPDGIEAMIAGTVKAFGWLDIVHNNAFGQPTLPSGQRRLAFLADLDERVWTHTIELGLTGVFRAMKRAIPELLARGGSAIVNTASISGLFADFAIGAYNTAKAGVINLTRVAAIEYASRGIRVNCVCPGAIDTPLLRSSLSIPGFAEQTLQMIPMRRSAARRRWPAS